MKDAQQFDAKAAQAAMLDVVKDLRSDKKRFAALKDKLKDVRTDDERAEILFDFVIDDIRVGRAFTPPGSEVMATTTVTVTTVIIIVPSAY